MWLRNLVLRTERYFEISSGSFGNNLPTCSSKDVVPRDFVNPAALTWGECDRGHREPLTCNPQRWNGIRGLSGLSTALWNKEAGKHRAARCSQCRA